MYLLQRKLDRSSQNPKMLQLLIGEIFFKVLIRCERDFCKIAYSNLWRKSIVDSVYRINLIDILFPFARVVSKRESGVLNSYRFLADIFEDSQEGDI